MAFASYKGAKHKKPGSYKDPGFIFSLSDNYLYRLNETNPLSIHHPQKASFLS